MVAIGIIVSLMIIGITLGLVIEKVLRNIKE